MKQEMQTLMHLANAYDTQNQCQTITVGYYLFIIIFEILWAFCYKIYADKQKQFCA